ncbi:hypothetical protein [Floridanema aerugineum]|uniref:Uncharacterized protein n=1 Tax=Floridaenema aerugineum BLCC-F46 TaxID=3153654 RepID=A0ABV4X1H5_9CYAN
MKQRYAILARYANALLFFSGAIAVFCSAIALSLKLFLNKEIKHL